MPQHLQEEQRALEAEIREAFKGVTREGGVSWSEAEAVDDGADAAERAVARAKDTDTTWTELADNSD